MLLSLLILSLLPSSLSIHRDQFLFDYPIDLSDVPTDAPPPDPFLPDIDDGSPDDDTTTLTKTTSSQLKQRENRGITAGEDVIDVSSLDSLDSYSSPLLSPDKYSSPDVSSITSSSDKYLSPSLRSGFTDPGPIIESGNFRLISSKLIRDPSVSSLDRPSVVQQVPYGAYPSAGAQQSYETDTVPSSSYSFYPSFPLAPSSGSSYVSPNLEGYSTGQSGVQSSAYSTYPTGGSSQYATATSQNYATPYQQGYSSGASYNSYPTVGAPQQYVTGSNYVLPSDQGYNGVYHLNGPIQGRRVVIYKKILRPVRIHTYQTIERLPGGKVVDQWAEGGYSSDQLGRSSVDAPLFTPTNQGFYPVNGR